MIDVCVGMHVCISMWVHCRDQRTVCSLLLHMGGSWGLNSLSGLESGSFTSWAMALGHWREPLKGTCHLWPLPWFVCLLMQRSHLITQMGLEPITFLSLSEEYVYMLLCLVPSYHEVNRSPPFCHDVPHKMGGAQGSGVDAMKSSGQELKPLKL